MTEEELREKIADYLDEVRKRSLAFPSRQAAHTALTLIREAGWRSPEEVDKMVEHRIYEMYANETYQP